ncbi:MAG: pilus assembly protein [Armatimonadetes bacterium]|nr:pilus assembly protein [Armatimonadota bacterium]
MVRPVALSRKGYVRRPRSRAVAAVELAFVLPLVALLFFSVVELGVLFKDALVLNQAVREACRKAGLGAPPSQVVAAVKSRAVTLEVSRLQVTTSYRTWTGTNWSNWQPLGASQDGTQNTAPPGAEVRVVARYSHPLLMGGALRFLQTDASGNGIAVSAAAVTRRE